MSKTVPFLRGAVTFLFSMLPWPLEIAGTFVLWHYGTLFSSNQTLSRDYRGIIAQIMPGDTWGVFARGIAYGLFALCILVWLGKKTLYKARILFAVLGLLAWGALVYSCWRNDVPFAIYRLYAGFLGAQAYVALLLRFHGRAHDAEDGD